MLRVIIDIKDPEWLVLCEDYWQSVPAEVEQLGRFLQSLFERYDRHAYNEAYRIAHQISGTAGSYEMPRTTQEARRLEALLRQLKPDCIDDPVCAQVRDAYGRLQSTLDILVAA